MSNSRYWYDQYKGQQSQSRKYGKDIDKLNRILNELQNNMGDETSKVNREVNDLQDDLRKGVRHDAAFTSRANALNNSKQKSTGADPELSRVIYALEEEIRRITRQKDNANRQSESCYRQYQTDKEQERKDLLNRIGLGGL